MSYAWSLIASWFETQTIKAASSIAYAVAYLGGQIIQLESKILAWVIDMSSFTKLPIVQTGWKIVRDFTNLFFIAILIYIAFATILRLSSYSAKKTLWKVVVIAILINFSLMFSGIIIDFSQMMFKYFIFATLQEKTGHQFGLAMADALKLQTFWSSDKSVMQTEDTNQPKDNLFTAFIKLLFIVIFTFIVVIVLGALVLILLVRNFWLWFLLILAPIAWFCWIAPIPIFSQYWKQWWKKFLQWAFMAPIMGFFLFLALTLYFGNKQNQEATTKTLIDENALKAQWGAGEAKSESIFSFNKPGTTIFNPINVMQLGLVLGFLIAGLMAGSALGSKTAGGALGLITKAGKGTQKWMQRKGTKGATKVAGAGLSGIAKGVSKIPLVGGALSKPFGVAGRGFQAKAEAIKKEERGKAAKRLEGKSLSDLDRDWKTLTENEKFAAVNKALKAGQMPKNMKAKAMELAEKGQISKKELLKIDPTLRQDWQERMKKINSLQADKSAATNAGNLDLANKIQQEINAETGKLQSNIKQDFEDKSATEISKTIASVDFGKAPLLAEAFVNNMADDPTKYNPYVVMDIVGQKPVAEKPVFVEALIRAKMNKSKKTTNLDKLADIEKNEPELVKKLNKSPGLRQINSTFDDIAEKICPTKKQPPPEEKGPIITPPPAHGGPFGAPAALPPHVPPSPPPSGWQPPSPPPPRTAPPEWTPPSAPPSRPREPWTPADTGPRPETFRPQRPTREIREQTRENPPKKYYNPREFLGTP